MSSSFWDTISRRQVYDESEDPNSGFHRVLKIWDLLAFGVGGTLGLGVYVLAGLIARKHAGPAVVLSFTLAAIAMMFSCLCYAEFAVRVPKSGSVYVYTYVCIGEYVAFNIGWTMLLEYIIGAATLSCGMSMYIDEMLGHRISKPLTEIMPINVEYFQPYPNLLALGLCIFMNILLAAGMKESKYANNIFTIVNLLNIAFVLVAGSIVAKFHNWEINKASIPENVTDGGEGGFLPFGIVGVVTGAAESFFGFIGIDAISTLSEEALDPQRSIPIATLLSLLIVYLIYIMLATVLTMALPYYEQSTTAPFIYLFDRLDWVVVKWIVSVGALFALSASLMTTTFPLPRILQAMSSDGLIFKQIRTINSLTGTPIRATIVATLMSGTMTTLFDLEHLVNLMSISALSAYTLVSICVLVLRYENSLKTDEEQPRTWKLTLFQVCNKERLMVPNETSTSIVRWMTAVYFFSATALCLYVTYGKSFREERFEAWLGVLISLIIWLFLIMGLIRLQPEDPKHLNFKVPAIPLVPCLGILINLFLMIQLQAYVWFQLGVWTVIGNIIYFAYGRSHSNLNTELSSL